MCHVENALKEKAFTFKFSSLIMLMCRLKPSMKSVFLWIIVIQFFVHTVEGQEVLPAIIENSDIDTTAFADKDKDQEKENFGFSFYIATGEYGFNRTSSRFVSPLISNNERSFGIGIASDLADYKHYKARLYVGYEQVSVAETFRRSDQSLFESRLQFKSVNVGIIPVILSIGDSFGGYIGAGGFVHYHIDTDIDSPDGTDFNIDVDEVFERVGYGSVVQLGVFYKTIRLEINGFSSFSDTSEVVGIPNLKRIGSTISLHYGF